MARPDENINKSDVHVIPNSLLQKFEYNSDGTVKYAGHAVTGSSTSDARAWTIQFFEYSSQRVTSISIAFGAWTNRDNLSYA